LTVKYSLVYMCIVYVFTGKNIYTNEYVAVKLVSFD